MKLSAGVLSLSALLLAAPGFAQDHVNAAGMPTNHSTPEEQAQTADLNRQIQQDTQAADAQAAANNAQFQAQQQQYQEQLQQNQAAQQQYANETAQYEALRDRYAAERRAYRRAVWPDRYRDWVVERDARLIGSRVEIVNGDRVGTVEAIARTRAGRIEALRVGLDSGRTVWIDEADIRFNRQDRIVITWIGPICAIWQDGASRSLNRRENFRKTPPCRAYSSLCQRPVPNTGLHIASSGYRTATIRQKQTVHRPSGPVVKKLIFCGF